MLDILQKIGPPAMGGSATLAREDGPKKSDHAGFAELLDNSKSGTRVNGSSANRQSSQDELRARSDKRSTQRESKLENSRSGEREALKERNEAIGGGDRKTMRKSSQAEVQSADRSDRVDRNNARTSVRNNSAQAQGKSEGNVEIAELNGSDQPERSFRVQKNPEVPERKIVIEEFMDSFESEFGIPPARLVQAMAQLSPQELQMSPERTADSVISKLQLPPDQEQKAQAMYVSLLMTLVAIDQKAKAGAVESMKAATGLQTQRIGDIAGMDLKANLTPVETPKSLGKERVSYAAKTARAVQPEMLSTSGADNLSASEKSLQRALESLSDAVDELENVTQDMGASKPLADQGFENVLAQDRLVDLPPHLQGQLKQVAGAQSAQSAEQAHRMSQLQKELGIFNESGLAMKPVAQSEALSAPASKAMALNGPRTEVPTAGQPESIGGLLGATGGLVGIMSQKQDMKQNTQDSASDHAATAFQVKSDPQAYSNASGSAKELSFKQFMEKARDLKAGDKKSLDTLMAQLPTSDVTPLNQLAEPNFVAGADIQPSPLDMQENLQKVMSHAQFLASKGGGEVRMKLKPEGLGELDLKMVLNNGRLQMQMSAETKEAKAAIEQSLGDLKTSLAAHKLSVEHIRVDVVNSAQTDMASQFNQNNGNGSGFNNPTPDRQGTSQFWQQFNQQFDTHQHRNFLMEPPQMTAGPSQKTEPLSPVSQSAQARAARAYGSKGQGLNMVA